MNQSPTTPTIERRPPETDEQPPEPPTGPASSPPGRGLWRVIDRVGRALIVLGGLILVFLVFQLWGTGLIEDRAQRGLADELQDAIERHRGDRAAVPSASVPSASGPSSVAADGGAAGGPGRQVPPGPDAPDVIVVPARPAPNSGSAVARIQAPAIDLDKTVVEGVGRTQLRDGPGRYPISALPGHVGNVAIAGHRTTHGSPFARLDELEPGDLISVETVDGVFSYRVEAQVDDDGVMSGHRIVSPDAVEVIADRGDNRLTLTSCHPRYSDRQRLVVTAVLEGTPLVFAQPASAAGEASPVADRVDPGAVPAEVVEPAVAPPLSGLELEEPLGWRWNELGVAVLWAALTLLAAAPAVLLRRRGHPRRALALLLVLAIYPLVHLMVALDQLAPAF